MVDIQPLPKRKAYDLRSSPEMQKAFVTQARQHLESRQVSLNIASVYTYTSTAIQYMFVYMYMVMVGQRLLN